jgi:DNA repair protein RecO (recombination protein O)
MRISDKAIVLHSVRYADKKYILKIYSREHGLLSVSCVAGSSPSSPVKRSSILPLSLIEVQVSRRENREVQQLSECAAYYLHTTIHESMTRLCIAQFMNELLLRCLKEQTGNPPLYDFIESCLFYLNESDRFMNIHLYFMLEFSRYAGFAPAPDFSAQTPYFDCREGVFTSHELAFPLGLDRSDSELLFQHLEKNLLAETLTNTVRQRLLEILSAYYQFHVPGFEQMKSVPVLKEVLAG